MKITISQTIKTLLLKQIPKGDKKESQFYLFLNFLNSMEFQICLPDSYTISDKDYKLYRQSISVREKLDYFLDTLQLDIVLTPDNNYILTPTQKLCEKREAYKSLFNIK